MEVEASGSARQARVDRQDHLVSVQLYSTTDYSMCTLCSPSSDIVYRVGNGPEASWINFLRASLHPALPTQRHSGICMSTA